MALLLSFQKNSICMSLAVCLYSFLQKAPTPSIQAWCLMNRYGDKVIKTFHAWLALSWNLVGSWWNLELQVFLKRCILANMREMSTYFLNLILKPFNSPIILLSLVYTINTGREGGREEGRKEGRKKGREEKENKRTWHWMNRTLGTTLVLEEHGLQRVSQISLMW